MTTLNENGSPISESQIDQYHRDGYLLVSGLIPDDIAAKAAAAMWRCAGIDSNNPPTSWDDVQGGICLYNSAALVDCFTPQCLAAAAQLTGEDPSTFSKLHRHPKTYCAPDFIAAQEARARYLQVLQMGLCLHYQYLSNPRRMGVSDNYIGRTPRSLP